MGIPADLEEDIVKSPRRDILRSWQAVRPTTSCLQTSGQPKETSVEEYHKSFGISDLGGYPSVADELAKNAANGGKKAHLMGCVAFR